ncbi:MAG: cytochrome c peroxidase [Acidobacteriota bacterium]|nr:cytochrome c peroxidase [Acidobacteriota bacterium]
MQRIKLVIALLAGFCIGSMIWWPSLAVRGQNTPLAAPTGVTASDGSYNNKIAVSWDTMRGATQYQVYRNTTNDVVSATSLGTTVEGVFYDTAANAGQSYFYWVRAENGQGVSSFSASDTGTRGSGATTGLNPPTAPAGNSVTATKATLGKVLFWDEQLSSTRTVACGTCHIARAGGSDPRSISSNTSARHPGADNTFGTADDIQGSPGVPLAQANGSYSMTAAFGLREQVTKRRSMPHINSGYPNLLFWEGRASSEFRDPITKAVVLATGAALESQALEPPVSDVEMGHKARDWNDVAARIASAKPLALAPTIPAALAAWIGERRYPELFQEAFGTPEVTPVRIALALATYQRTLNSDRAPVDRGELTEQEARGQQVFNANECNDCHAGPLFGTNQLQNTGVRPSSEDTGRFGVTNNQNDLGRFRSVSLRNVELRAPYFHNGRFNTLEDVVEFYNRGGDFPGPNTNRREIRPLNLTAQQKADLVAFLKRPLTDPRVAAELPPFDRPMLYSESMRVPQIIGSGVAGAGGQTPQATAIEPPVVGNPRFTVAVQNVLGGAMATLVIDENDPGATATVPASASFARATLQLGGTGAGNGFGSVSLAIPDHTSLVGKTFYGRWYISEAQSVAVSPAFKFTIFGNSDNRAAAFAGVSAASFALGAVAPESVVVGFGVNLASATIAANALPLPETLGGVTVTIKDVLGVERRAPLFFVSPGQINYLLPAAVALGEATVTVQQNGNVVASGLLQIAPVAPGVFTVDANGRGLPAATVLRVKADGSQSYEPVARFDAATNRHEAVPIDLGAATDQLYLIPFGTGFRNRSSLATVSCTIGGANAEVIYAGTQPQFVGVDQLNILIPRSVAGRGNVEVQLRADGKTANTVTINIK